ELDPVGVLELVDEQITESFAAAPAEFGHSLERIDDLEDQVVEIAQPAGRQGLFVGLVDKVQDLDRLQLGMRRLPRGRVDGIVPMLGVQLESTLVEARGRDASALQLEQEPQPGAEELVEVVDAQSREGVGIERAGLAAAQACHQPALLPRGAGVAPAATRTAAARARRGPLARGATRSGTRTHREAGSRCRG